MEPDMLHVGMSLLGTMIGTGGGIIISSKLTNYRLEQLEQKMNKHNNFIERVFILEGTVKSTCEKIVTLQKKVEEI